MMSALSSINYLYHGYGEPIDTIARKRKQYNTDSQADLLDLDLNVVGGKFQNAII